MSKRKAAPEINLFCMQAILDDFAQEIFGPNPGKRFVEVDDDCLFDPEDAQSFDLLIECLQQWWRGLGMQDGARMWLKRDHGWHRANFARALHDGLHDELMAEMQTVEHPEGDHGRTYDLGIFGSVE
jgi:hypothetical protein